MNAIFLIEDTGELVPDVVVVVYLAACVEDDVGNEENAADHAD